MTTPRDLSLSPEQLALKLAFREAVHAAGGQPFVAGEVGRAQSRISDWCSPNTPDFAPIEVVRTVEALGAGKPGHPHVTRALARAQGAGVVAGAGALPHGMSDLGDWMAALSKEFGDLIGELAGEDLAGACAELSPRARADIGREAGDMIDRLRQLRSAIDGCEGAAVRHIGPRRADTS